MDLEKVVRAAFPLREPRKDFEDVVMARLSAAAWRASQARPRRRRRLLAISALVAGSAGAAILVAQYSGPSSAPAAFPAQPVAVAPLVVQNAASLTAPVAASASASGLASPGVPSAIDVSQLCAAAAAVQPAAASYTVLAEPLQFQTDDPAIQARMQEYYGLLLDQMRKVPGLALIGHEAQAAGTRQADFRITIDKDIDRGGKSSADRPDPWFTLKLEAWSGTGFQLRSTNSQQVRNLDDSHCLAAANCRSIAAAAAVMNLRAQLPRSFTPVQAACEDARREFAAQQIAQQRKADPTMDLAAIRGGLDQLVTTADPAARRSLRIAMTFVARPELVAPLLAALRETPEDALRKELVTLLVVKFADDPAAREALASAARSSTDSLMRHVAERASSSDAQWRDYVVASLRDTSLPTAQRLEPLYWMSDALPLDEQKMSAELAGVLTALQAGDGVRVLTDLLAGTQKEVGPAASSVASQRGQWALRYLGSVNHPAAPELLIACFDAMPNYLTLDVLATRRDDPRVTSKLQFIATQQAAPRLRNMATRYLNQPLDPQRATPLVN